MKAVLRWIGSNIPLLVLSFVLASLAWVVALEQEDPTLEEPYSQLIPITLSGLPEGMVIVGEFNERVQVTVRAPGSVLRTLTVDDFTATVDLSGLRPGVYQVAVQLVLNKQPSQITSIGPEYVTLELESEAEKTVPVHVQIEGEKTLGYVMRAPTIVPRQVVVSGPSSYVNRVIEATTVVSVQDASADVEGEFQLRLRDSEGQPVPYVTLTPEMVSVRVPIELSGYYRPLPIKVILEGQIAPGYRTTDVTVEPPTVTVFGALDVIDTLPGYIETEPIDVEGAQADVIARPALNVPPNVAVVPGQQPVEVRISIEPLESGLTMEVKPELQGLGPGLTATTSLEGVQIILSGPLPLLEELEADDVRVVLDLFELPRGTHQIEPEVIVPEGVTVQSILPATVQVEIATAPTPQPEPSPEGPGEGPVAETPTPTSTEG